MPSLRPVKVRVLVRILAKLGFSATHQSGSHLFFRHMDGRTTVVPIHLDEEIGKGLLRRMLKQIGLAPEDFEKHL